MKLAQLIYNPETDRFEHNGYGLHCGDCFDVLVPDVNGDPQWVETRIELGKTWYLVDLPGFQIDGLFARM